MNIVAMGIHTGGDRSLNSVRVYAREGSYRDYENDESSWTIIHSEENVESFGFGAITPLESFQEAVSILKDESVSFFVTNSEGRLLSRSWFEAGLELVSTNSISLYSGITSANINSFGGTQSGASLWNGSIKYCPLSQQDNSLSQQESISLETSSNLSSTSSPQKFIFPTLSATPSISTLTLTPTAGVSLQSRDETWVQTDKENYVKGERIVVTWNNLNPSVGDSIVFSFVDPEYGWFIAKVIRPICEEESCLSTANYGTMEINPEPKLEEDTFYVSLYNRKEIIHSTFNVVARTMIPTMIPTMVPTPATSLPSSQPTSIPSSQPTSSQPSRSPTINTTTQPTQNPSILPTSKPSTFPSSVIPTNSPTKGPTMKPTIKFVSEDSIVADKKIYTAGEDINVAYYRKEPEIGDTLSLNFFNEEMGWFIDVAIHVVCDNSDCASGPQRGVIAIKTPPDLAEGQYYISFYSPDQKELSFTEITIDGSKSKVAFPKAAPRLKPTQTPTSVIHATTEYGIVKFDANDEKLNVNMIEASKSFYGVGDSIEYSWYRSNPKFGDKVAISYYDTVDQSYKLVDVQYICIEKTVKCGNNGKNSITPWPSLTPDLFYVSLLSADNKEMDYDRIVVT